MGKRQSVNSYQEHCEASLDLSNQDDAGVDHCFEPPSLKKQALCALYAIATGADDTREFYQDLETIKQALESLPD